MASTVNATAHGLSVSDPFRFANSLPTDSGVDETLTYYVLASNFGANSFEFSLTDGGAAVTVDHDITSTDLIDPDSYEEIDEVIMSPPEAVATPGNAELTYAVLDTVVRAIIALPTVGQAKLRLVEVALTREYSGATPVWTDAAIFSVPPEQTSLSLPVLPSTQYSARARWHDVYGQVSDWGAAWTAISDAGLDSLASATSSALDHLITETEIDDDSISTPKLQANVVTADKVASGTIAARHLSVSAERLNLIVNGMFEEFSGSAASYAYPSPIYGWTATSADVLSTASLSSNARSGSYIAVVKSSAAAASNSGLTQRMPVREGRRYRLSGWAWKSTTGGEKAQILAHSRNKDGSIVAFNAMVAVSQNTSTPTYGDAFYTVPAGVRFLDVYARWVNTPTTSEVFAFEDVMFEEVPQGFQNTTAEVVIDETGITITNGKITVTNPGSTVIIDGTSNMFKIVTSGTLTASATTNADAVSSAILSGTGLSAVTPAFIAWLTQGTSPSSTANRDIGRITFRRFSPPRGWTSSTSGGSPVNDFLPLHWQAFAFSGTEGVNDDPTLYLKVENATGVTNAAFMRYHLLKEAAI